MEITTERCAIRRFQRSDLDDFMRYRNDEAWMRYQGFKGKTREEYEKALLGELSFEGGAQLAIVQSASGRLIGDLYLKKESGAYWVGCTLSPAYARQGYAAEALSALIAWIRRQGDAVVQAAVLPDNAASIGLIKKLGFQHVGEDESGEEIFHLPAERIP